MIRDTYLDTALVSAKLLRRPEIAERWSQPSALDGFTVGGLAHHLANQIVPVPARLGNGADGDPIPLLAHYTRNTWVTSGVDSEDNTGIRVRSEESATDLTADQLADQVDAAVQELRQSLHREPVGRPVDLGEWALTVEDFLVTRIMELVVHGDDLAVSIDVATPGVPEAASRITIDLLARISAWRHGPLPLVRALARQERAPATISAF